jgi:hypothetical protein
VRPSPPFRSGETTRTFTIDVLPDGLPEGDETIALSLDVPTGGAVLGARNTSTLKIGDRQPVVQFAAATYAMSEKLSGPSNATLTVTRTGLARRRCRWTSP